MIFSTYPSWILLILRAVFSFVFLCGFCIAYCCTFILNWQFAPLLFKLPLGFFLPSPLLQLPVLHAHTSSVECCWNQICSCPDYFRSLFMLCPFTLSLGKHFFIFISNYSYFLSNFFHILTSLFSFSSLPLSFFHKVFF